VEETTPDTQRFDLKQRVSGVLSYQEHRAAPLDLNSVEVFLEQALGQLGLRQLASEAQSCQEHKTKQRPILLEAFEGLRIRESRAVVLLFWVVRRSLGSQAVRLQAGRLCVQRGLVRAFELPGQRPPVGPRAESSYQSDDGIWRIR
jgi:hypothetical protein